MKLMHNQKCTVCLRVEKYYNAYSPYNIKFKKSPKLLLAVHAKIAFFHSFCTDHIQQQARLRFTRKNAIEQFFVFF